MDLTVRSVDAVARTALIRVAGPITSQVSGELAATIRDRIRRRDLFVHLVLTDVPYVNSAGLGSLLDWAAELDRRGGALFIVDVQAKVRLLFENLGLLHDFRFAGSSEEANRESSRLLERTVRSPRLILLPSGDEFPVTGTSIRIGSDSKSTIPIRHPHVELRHAEIYRTGDRCFVRDLGTRFGTFVGGRKVNEEALKAGDIVQIGSARLLYAPEGQRPSGGRA